MEYLLKIYVNQNAVNPFTVVENINNIDINFELESFSTMSIKVPINTSGLSQFNKVELCSVSNGDDVIEFGGYIHNIKPSLGDITLECRDYKALFDKKLVLSDKEFTSTTVTLIMDNILSEWNTQTSENWTFSSSFAGPVTKDLSYGDNMSDVLDELADLTLCVWKVDGSTIIFNEIIGVDRSIPANDNFFELVYNGDDLTENNIDTIETETYGTRSNLVIGTDNTTKVTLKDTASITAIGVFAEYKSFRKGNLTANVQNYLDLVKDEQRTYSIRSSKNTGDELNIGDKIHLRVEGMNEYMNIETDVYILGKEISIENGTKIFNLTVSNIYAKLDSFTRKINNITKEINLLSL